MLWHSAYVSLHVKNQNWVVAGGLVYVYRVAKQPESILGKTEMLCQKHIFVACSRQFKINNFNLGYILQFWQSHIILYSYYNLRLIYQLITKALKISRTWHWPLQYSKLVKRSRGFKCSARSPNQIIWCEGCNCNRQWPSTWLRNEQMDHMLTCQLTFSMHSIRHNDNHKIGLMQKILFLIVHCIFNS